MENRVIVDTGPLVAFLNRQDRHHAWTLERLAEMDTGLITSEAVLSETIYLVGSSRKALEAIREMVARDIIQVKSVLNENPAKICDLLIKFADLPASLTDISLVHLYDTGQGRAIFTLDSDFLIYRDSKGRRLRLVAPFG